MSVSSQPPTPGLSLNRSQSILVVWNSDIPRLRNDAKRLNLTPFLFFTLNLRGRLQGIGNGFGACIFFSVRAAENASLGRRTSSPKLGGLKRFQRTLNQLRDSQFRIGFPDDGRSGAARII